MYTTCHCIRHNLYISTTVAHNMQPLDVSNDHPPVAILLPIEFPILRIVICTFAISMCLFTLYKLLFAKATQNEIIVLLSNIPRYLLRNSLEFIEKFRLGIWLFTKLIHNMLKLQFMHVKYVYFILVTIPTFIAAILFFIDIIICHYFFYFYRFLPILILPLFTLVVKAILSIWSKDVIEILEKKLKVLRLSDK